MPSDCATPFLRPRSKPAAFRGRRSATANPFDEKAVSLEWNVRSRGAVPDDWLKDTAIERPQGGGFLSQAQGVRRRPSDGKSIVSRWTSALLMQVACRRHGLHCQPAFEWRGCLRWGIDYSKEIVVVAFHCMPVRVLVACVVERQLFFNKCVFTF